MTTEQTKMLTGKTFTRMGFPESPAIATLLRIVQEQYAGKVSEALASELKAVLEVPDDYIAHDTWSEVAQQLIALRSNIIPLTEGKPYEIFGSDFIEKGAHKQMATAMRLPVTVAGAMMPDAHQGYGLPIGGVLATSNVVIPYGVGVDIGCRMALSVLDIPESHFLANEAKYKRELIAHTNFGAGQGFKGDARWDHAVLSSPVFDQVPMVKALKDRAWAQLGTSGGGNHFVEWGILELLQEDASLNLPKGRYVALLTHSGSRGLGAPVAAHYTQLAKQLCPLPQEAANLAYLDLNAQEGQEYWLAMNLAGDFASACHEVIHTKLVKAMGAQVLARVENHHNFAWKEMYNGQEVIVHRKGATPASEGVLGIIPGSMTAPGFLVKGKGHAASINSASHGAGRQMSRTAAIKTFTKQELRTILKDHGVTLVGGGLDEAPGAYKDIRTVMSAQQDLVEVLAQFTPKIVRMADDGSRED